jgi:hypothetical protein
VEVHLLPLPLEVGPEAPALVSSRDLPGPAVAGGQEPPAGPAPGSDLGEEAPPAPAGEALLPPLGPLPLDERGFFAGDLLVLELTLVDRLTGEPRWTKWIEEEADPCDQAAVRQVLDRAFAEPAGWLPAR